MGDKSMTEHRLFSKKGALIECIISFEQMPEFPKIEHCYREALSCFLVWLERERLPALAAEESAFRASGKRRRLHQIPERWCFTLTAQSAGTYLSVCLCVRANGEGFERQWEEFRVWDSEKDILCPLSRFIPTRKARKYEQWSFALTNDELTVYRKGKLQKITLPRKDLHNHARLSI